MGYGFLLGTAGVKMLGSRDAKKVYTQVTAAALRGVDEVTRAAANIKENCEDIAAEAKLINERRCREARQREIEDAKARKVPLIIPIGTIEYHGEHASLGTDTMVITGVLERLGKKKEIIVAPPIWYGVASYAVCGPEKNTIQVDSDPYEIYITEILKSLVYGGWKNIYLVFHHQSEGDGLMPMSLACMKAAKKVTLRYLEETRGNGWWGSNDMQDYYENLDTSDNPMTFIKTIQLMDNATQQAIGGFDHAGKYETSLLSAVYPDNVDFERTHWNTEWFAIPSREASRELGEMMVEKTLEYLERTIV